MLTQKQEYKFALFCFFGNIFSFEQLSISAGSGKELKFDHRSKIIFDDPVKILFSITKSVRYRACAACSWSDRQEVILVFIVLVSPRPMKLFLASSTLNFDVQKFVI